MFTWRAYLNIVRRGKNMKLRSFGLLVMVVALGLSLAACGCFQQAMKGEVAPPAAPEQKVVAAPEEKPPMVVTPPPAMAPAPAAVEVQLTDIHFDFDKYDIRPGDRDMLKQDYDWISAKSAKVRIEGNCDERGTVEYNMVLGQKRADAAKAYLVSLGVDPKRLDTISYGKERPVDPGHNEAAWAQNRRDHFAPVE
jgi:peptidoglycan-associated lipoprotein